MYEVPCGAVVVIDLWWAGGARCPVVLCPGVWYQTVCCVSHAGLTQHTV